MSAPEADTEGPVLAAAPAPTLKATAGVGDSKDAPGAVSGQQQLQHPVSKSHSGVQKESDRGGGGGSHVLREGGGKSHSGVYREGGGGGPPPSSREHSLSQNTRDGSDSDASDPEEDVKRRIGRGQVVETSPQGRYVRFNERMGAGQYKEVYRAFDTTEGIEVAWNTVNIKQLPKEEKRRIINEVRLLHGLDHKNLVEFHGSWVNREKDQVVFVTEILMGGSLMDFIRRVELIRWKVIKRWARQILKGLNYLHAEHNPPIIHRDLKCDNIFINGHTGDIRIGDLGLSTSNMRSDKTMSVLGTPEFMAPELYDESYDEKVDIYAFGMCMLEMITKERPYSECANAAQIYKKVTSQVLPAVLHRVHNPRAREFIGICLQFDPSLRPSAAELRDHPFLTDKNEEEDNEQVYLDPPEAVEANISAYGGGGNGGNGGNGSAASAVRDAAMREAAQLPGTWHPAQKGAPSLGTIQEAPSTAGPRGSAGAGDVASNGARGSLSGPSGGGDGDGGDGGGGVGNGNGARSPESGNGSPSAQSGGGGGGEAFGLLDQEEVSEGEGSAASAAVGAAGGTLGEGGDGMAAGVGPGYEGRERRDVMGSFERDMAQFDEDLSEFPFGETNMKVLNLPDGRVGAGRRRSRLNGGSGGSSSDKAGGANNGSPGSSDNAPSPPPARAAEAAAAGVAVGGGVAAPAAGPVAIASSVPPLVTTGAVIESSRAGLAGQSQGMRQRINSTASTAGSVASISPGATPAPTPKAGAGSLGPPSSAGLASVQAAGGSGRQGLSPVTSIVGQPQQQQQQGQQQPSARRGSLPVETPPWELPYPTGAAASGNGGGRLPFEGERERASTVDGSGVSFSLPMSPEPPQRIGATPSAQHPGSAAAGGASELPPMVPRLPGQLAAAAGTAVASPAAEQQQRQQRPRARSLSPLAGSDGAAASSGGEGGGEIFSSGPKNYLQGAGSGGGVDPVYGSWPGGGLIYEPAPPSDASDGATRGERAYSNSGEGDGPAPGLGLVGRSGGESVGDGSSASQTQIKYASSQGPERDVMRLVMCVQLDGRLQEVEFDLNLEHDRPEEVAEEMIEQLELPKAEHAQIAETIAQLAERARNRRMRRTASTLGGGSDGLPPGGTAAGSSSASAFLGGAGGEEITADAATAAAAAGLQQQQLPRGSANLGLGTPRLSLEGLVEGPATGAAQQPFAESANGMASERESGLLGASAVAYRGSARGSADGLISSAGAGSDLSDDDGDDVEQSEDYRRALAQHEKRKRQAEKAYQSRLSSLENAQNDRMQEHLRALERHRKECEDFEKKMLKMKYEFARRMEEIEMEWAEDEERIRSSAKTARHTHRHATQERVAEAAMRYATAMQQQHQQAAAAAAAAEQSSRSQGGSSTAGPPDITSPLPASGEDGIGGGGGGRTPHDSPPLHTHPQRAAAEALGIDFMASTSAGGAGGLLPGVVSSLPPAPPHHSDGEASRRRTHSVTFTPDSSSGISGGGGGGAASSSQTMAPSRSGSADLLDLPLSPPAPPASPPPQPLPASLPSLPLGAMGESLSMNDLTHTRLRDRLDTA